MTQAVNFHFISPHFRFESGRVWFSKGARLFSDGEFHEGDIKDGVVDGVLVEGPIQFDAWLSDLTVVRSNDGRRYHVKFLRVTGDLPAENLRSGRVLVRLNLPVILIVRVEDPDGQPVSDVRVNLLLPGWEGCVEGPTDARGEIVLLADAGWHSAKIVVDRNRRVSADIPMTPADSGVRLVILRLPPLP